MENSPLHPAADAKEWHAELGALFQTFGFIPTPRNRGKTSRPRVERAVRERRQRDAETVPCVERLFRDEEACTPEFSPERTIIKFCGRSRHGARSE